ncbi:MAG TPA: phospholipid carrier-dependent glycosyltransferase, partial [Anaerolineales bacterium]|nr:phospholipid carrier-dependent glycosyltransferase [Anaerolineales bacterium]
MTKAKELVQNRYLRYYWLIILLASAVIATSAEVWFTRNGPGVSGDSVHYMQGANNLVAGKGFSRLKANGQYLPITGFPPGFSIALASLGQVGIPAFEAGRFLNSILFGLNTALVGWLIYRASRSGLLAILGGWMFMYARNIVQIHSWVMSEPLFLFLSLLTIVLLDLYLQRDKLALLILASLLIGFASLTRYVGLSLIPAACIAILFFSPHKSVRKWRDILLSVIISLTPVILWFWHNAQVTGNPVNRQMIYHPISKNLIFTLFNELSYWWFAPSLSLPWKVRWGLLFLFFVLGLGIFLYQFYKQQNRASSDRVSPISIITATFLAFYVLALLLNTSFIDASTDEPSIKRYAIPLIAVGIIWTFTSYALVGRQGWSKNIAHSILIILGLGMTLFYASKSVSFILHPGFSFGYTDDLRSWTCEVDMLRAMDARQVTITNDYEQFYFLAGRPAYALTGKFDPYLNKLADDFSSSIEIVENMLRGGAVLAILGNPDQYPNEANALIGD